DGVIVKPGDPEASPLIKAIRYDDKDLRMPPDKTGGKLPDPIIADLVQWIKAGAPYPETPPGERLSNLKPWAFAPVRKSGPPSVKNTAWGATAIDPFILAKIEAKGLRPSPQADKRTLLRRAAFDLTGLPPTPDQMDAFLGDAAPDAFAKVVD